MSEIDLRPQAIDMSLCVNTICQNKCKRYYENWKPNIYNQSYINPSFKYDKNGKQEECKCKMEW